MWGCLGFHLYVVFKLLNIRGIYIFLCALMMKTNAWNITSAYYFLQLILYSSWPICVDGYSNGSICRNEGTCASRNEVYASIYGTLEINSFVKQINDVYKRISFPRLEGRFANKQNTLDGDSHIHPMLITRKVHKGGKVWEFLVFAGFLYQKLPVIYSI